MKTNLGIFGSVNIDTHDSVYLQDWVVISSHAQLVGLQIDFSVFEFDDVTRLNHYLQRDVLHHLDQYTRSLWQTPDVHVQQFITRHFDQLADELYQYHQIEPYDYRAFIEQLNLYQLIFQHEQGQMVMTLEYGIDRQLSDDVLRYSYSDT